MSKNYILVLLNVLGATIGRPLTWCINAFFRKAFSQRNGQGRAMLTPTRVFGSLIDVLWLRLTMWTATAGVVRARKRFAAS